MDDWLDEVELSPLSQGCDRLMAAGLWPPIVDFGERKGGDGECYAHLQHDGVLSVEHADRIKQVMGSLPYRLQQVTLTDDGTVIDANGKVLSQWSRRDRPEADDLPT
jgi:hypothetical protein